MRGKIGTVIDASILARAKERAAREGRALAGIVQDALINYLRQEVARGDALRACDKFCSHGSALGRHEIDELLQEDMLASTGRLMSPREGKPGISAGGRPRRRAERTGRA